MPSNTQNENIFSKHKISKELWPSQLNDEGSLQITTAASLKFSSIKKTPTPLTILASKAQP